jgi:hypothetical protein
MLMGKQKIKKRASGATQSTQVQPPVDENKARAERNAKAEAGKTTFASALKVGDELNRNSRLRESCKESSRC